MRPKQKRFCDEYLIDLNATQAAIRAGYAESTAAKASDWINASAQEKPSSDFNPDMANYIRQRMAEKDEKLIARQDEVLKYLTRVMRRQEVDYGTNVVSDGEGTSRVEITQLPTKVADASRAAELLGKRYGLFDGSQAGVLADDPLLQLLEAWNHAAGQ